MSSRSTTRSESKDDREKLRLNDTIDLRGLSQEERYKRQKLDMHNKTIAVLNSRALTARCKNQVAGLASRTETAATNIKNYFDMARAIERTPDPSNEIWKLHCSAVEECKNLMKLQKTYDDEEGELVDSTKKGQKDENISDVEGNTGENNENEQTNN